MINTMYCLSLLALCVSLGTVSGACRPDWIPFGESCYAFGETVFDWPEAGEVCRGAGGKLAEIETTEENEFLKHQATQRNAGNYWIGGTDMFHEGVWSWHSTGNLIDFSDWVPGQPDDYQTHEDCMILWQVHNYLWDDTVCSSNYYFICEMGAEEPIVG